MKRKRKTLLALICALVLTNTAVVFAIYYDGVDKYCYDYPGNITGFARSFIVESTWGWNRGTSSVTFAGSDAEFLSKTYEATSSLGTLADLGRNGSYGALRTYSKVEEHGWFSSVTTTLAGENSKITVTVEED